MIAGALLFSWVLSGFGLTLIVWGWLSKGHAIRKQRLIDCGVALVFSGVFARVVLAPERSWVDWSLGAVAIVFIAASIWRLTHTQASAGEPSE